MLYMLRVRFGPLKASTILFLTALSFVVGFLLVDAISASAADVVPVPDAPAVSAVNLYVVALGFVSPIVGYLLNYALPTTSAQMKGIVQGAIAAGVGVLVGAASGADLGLNDVTLLNAATAVLVSVGAHLAYKSGDVNGFFGGGKNKQNGDKLFQKTPG